MLSGAPGGMASLTTSLISFPSSASSAPNSAPNSAPSAVQPSLCRAAVGPGVGGFEPGAELEEQSLAQRRPHHLHRQWQPIVALEERQRDGRLSGYVEDRCERRKEGRFLKLGERVGATGIQLADAHRALAKRRQQQRIDVSKKPISRRE